jgi:hypothetical protein
MAVAPTGACLGSLSRRVATPVAVKHLAKARERTAFVSGQGKDRGVTLGLANRCAPHSQGDGAWCPHVGADSGGLAWPAYPSPTGGEVRGGTASAVRGQGRDDSLASPGRPHHIPLREAMRVARDPYTPSSYPCMIMPPMLCARIKSSPGEGGLLLRRFMHMSFGVSRDGRCAPTRRACAAPSHVPRGDAS